NIDIAADDVMEHAIPLDPAPKIGGAVRVAVGAVLLLGEGVENRGGVALRAALALIHQGLDTRHDRRAIGRAAAIPGPRRGIPRAGAASAIRVGVAGGIGMPPDAVRGEN